MKYIVLVSFLIVTFGRIAVAQDTKKEKRAAQYDEMLELIESEKYEFIGRTANPQRGPQIDLTTRTNFLSIQSGDATADMPYFGRAYNAGYSGDGGIKFNGPMESYNLKKNDTKYKVTIKFKVKGIDDTYNCTLLASSFENATLTISSNNRAVISYFGIIQKLSR
jgi:hypothetical protein